MQDLLQLLGANIIGGLILLIGITLNVQINTASRDISEDTINLRSAITSVQIAEYDIQKAGYNVGGEKIVEADSNRFKFQADLTNNGVVKTIYYYTSSDTVMSATTNPNDRLLYRKIDSGTSNILSVITQINFTYYDSIGTQISYANLSSAANRAKIRTIGVYLKTEITDPIDSLYKPIEWKRIIRPINLM